MANRIFQIPKPIIAMVHLQYKGNLNQLIDETLIDIEKLEKGGVDGLLFENWGGDYTDRFVTQEIREGVTTVIKEASKRTKLSYGINVLPLDYEASFNIAKQTNAKFTQIDTFVDKVRTDYKNKFIINIRPQDVINYKKMLNLNEIVLFTNIQTKHYKTIPQNKKLETSAIQAIKNGANVLVVTGKSTGKKTPKKKLVRVKKVSEEIPVFIGSGFDVSNAEELFPYADGVIVGKSLKYKGVIENSVDENRVKQLMEVIYRLRK